MADIEELSNLSGHYQELSRAIPTHDLQNFEQALNDVAIAAGRNSAEFGRLSNATSEVARSTTLSRVEFTRLVAEYSNSVNTINLRLQSFVNLSKIAGTIDPFNAPERIQALSRYSMVYGSMVDRIFSSSNIEKNKLRDTTEAYRLRELAIARGDFQMGAFIEATIRGADAQDTFSVRIRKANAALADGSLSMGQWITQSGLIKGALGALDNPLVATAAKLALLVGTFRLGRGVFSRIAGRGAAAEMGAATGGTRSYGGILGNFVSHPDQIAARTLSEEAAEREFLESQRTLRGQFPGRAGGILAGSRNFGRFMTRPAMSSGAIAAISGALDVAASRRGHGERTEAVGGMLFGTAFAAAGAALGTAAGSPIGTIAGGIIGQVVGDKIGRSLFEHRESLKEFNRTMEKNIRAANTSESFAGNVHAALRNIAPINEEYTSPFLPGGAKRALLTAQQQLIQSQIGLGASPQMQINNIVQLNQSLKEQISRIEAAPLRANRTQEDQRNLERRVLHDHGLKSTNLRDAVFELERSGRGNQVEQLRKELLALSRPVNERETVAAKMTRDTAIAGLQAQINQNVHLVRRTYMEQMTGAAMNLGSGSYTMPADISRRQIFGAGYVEGSFSPLTKEDVAKRSKPMRYNDMWAAFSSDVQNPIARDIQTAINNGKIATDIAEINAKTPSLGQGDDQDNRPKINEEMNRAKSSAHSFTGIVKDVLKHPWEYGNPRDQFRDMLLALRSIKEAVHELGRHQEHGIANSR